MAASDCDHWAGAVPIAGPAFGAEVMAVGCDRTCGWATCGWGTCGCVGDDGPPGADVIMPGDPKTSRAIVLKLSNPPPVLTVLFQRWIPSLVSPTARSNSSLAM